jgi:hypothetical protein
MISSPRILVSVTIETECDSMGVRCLLSATVAEQQGFIPHYLDRTIICSHAQGMPRCRLVRPLSIPGAGDGARFPRESFHPRNQSLHVLADYSSTFQGHTQPARQGRVQYSRYATSNYSLFMIFVAMCDAAEFWSLSGGPYPIAAEWGRIAGGEDGTRFPGVLPGLSRANSTLSWAATDPTAWRLTDLPRSKADAVEMGRAVDPPPLRRDSEMSRADEYPARQSCRG